MAQTKKPKKQEPASWYDYADELVAQLNLQYTRLFDTLKLSNFDELNVVSKVTEVYDQASKLAKKAYQDIAFYIFLLARKYAYRVVTGSGDSAGIPTASSSESPSLSEKSTSPILDQFINKAGKLSVTKQERTRAAEVITSAWVSAFLEKSNPVTGFIFDNEVERKKQRLIEALASSPNPIREIDNAKRYWTAQSTQYADDITDAAMLEGYKDVPLLPEASEDSSSGRPAGIKYVRWVTEEDGKVCPVCAARHGRIYPIDEVPPKPHYHCRCWVEPLPEWLALNKTGDTLLDVLGPIITSNPEEMWRIISEAQECGVEIRDSEAGMSYSPGLKPGHPGQLLISPTDSLAAWLHEEQHMLDDAKDGWPGFAGLFDVERRCRMEYNAYKKEVNIARSIGREDLAQELIQACRKEIESFGGDWDASKFR